MVDAFAERRKLIIELLGQIDGFVTDEPEGAFYVFPDISAFFGREIKGHKIYTANDFSLFLLEKALVATVSGESFGAPNCIRISYAASVEQIKEAVERIHLALS